MGRTAAVAPSGAPIVEKTTITKETGTAAQLSPGTPKQPDFAEYVASLDPDNWGEHLLYIYRIDPKVSNAYSSDPGAVEKCAGYIDMPNNVRLPINDKESLDFAIREKHGGRAFRLILKRGSEWICQAHSVNDLPPKFLTGGTPGQMPLPSAGNGQQDPTVTVASQAMNMVGNQQSDGIKIATDALRTMADILARQANTPAVPGSTDSIKDRVFEALVLRALEPPKQTDPLDLIIKVKDLFAPAPVNGVQQTLELIGALKSSGLFSVGGRGGGLVEAATQVLPTVANAAVEGIREWRLGMEAQASAVIAQRGGTPQTPAANPPAATPTQLLPPGSNVPKNAQPVPQENPQGTMTFPQVEQLIVNVLKDNLTVSESVDEVLTILYRIDPNLVALLLDPPKLHPSLPPGEKGLLALFQNEPVLQQIPVNPRLVEFIKKFIEVATEDERVRLAQAQQPPQPSA